MKLNNKGEKVEKEEKEFLSILAKIIKSIKRQRVAEDVPFTKGEMK